MRSLAVLPPSLWHIEPLQNDPPVMLEGCERVLEDVKHHLRQVMTFSPSRRQIRSTRLSLIIQPAWRSSSATLR
jgi:hypothetical protein